MNLLKVTVFGLILVLSLPSCQSNKNRKKNGYKVPDIDLQVKRFESEFCKINPNDIHGHLSALHSQNPTFYPFFVENILSNESGFAITTDAEAYADYGEDVLKFCSSELVSALHDTVHMHFPNETTFLPELKVGLYNYQKHFPKHDLPEIVTFVSAFENGIFTYDQILAIGLDMYLGEKSLFYEYVNFPQFIRHRLTPKFIAPNSMNVMATNLMENLVDGNLLDHMIYFGKALYFTEQMLPHLDDETVIGYTKEQLEWCKASELSIWSFFVENELLYNSIYSEFVKYITDTPTTSGMPKESPGKIGSWLGWQIVRAYMNKNPEVSMEELLNDTDAKKMLILSKYKPKK